LAPEVWGGKENRPKTKGKLSRSAKISNTAGKGSSEGGKKNLHTLYGMKESDRKRSLGEGGERNWGDGHEGGEFRIWGKGKGDGKKDHIRK